MLVSLCFLRDPTDPPGLWEVWYIDVKCLGQRHNEMYLMRSREKKIQCHIIAFGSCLLLEVSKQTGFNGIIQPPCWFVTTLTFTLHPISPSLHWLLPTSPGVFSLGVPVDDLFFIGNQLVATSHTGKVGVWNAVTQHWQVGGWRVRVCVCVGDSVSCFNQASDR